MLGINTKHGLILNACNLNNDSLEIYTSLSLLCVLENSLRVKLINTYSDIVTTRKIINNPPKTIPGEAVANKSNKYS